MHAAIAAARQAFMTDWRWRNRTERAQLLLACADVLEDHATEPQDLLSLENGKPVADARDNDLRFLTGVFRFFGALSTNYLAAIFMTAAAFSRQRFWSLSGVVGAIIPFNWPPIHTGAKSRRLSRWVTQSFSSQGKRIL